MYLLSWALSPCCFRERVHRLTVYTLFEGTSIPLAFSASTWSFIKAISGEITRVMPSKTRAGNWGVAEGLAATCGHQRQAVPPAQDGAYYFFLQGPKAIVSEAGFEDSKRSGTVHESANLSLLDSSLGRGRETRVILSQ